MEGNTCAVMGLQAFYVTSVKMATTMKLTVEVQ